MSDAKDDAKERNPELSPDDVEDVEGEELPDREVMTLVNPFGPPPTGDDVLMPLDPIPDKPIEETGGPYRE